MRKSGYVVIGILLPLLVAGVVVLSTGPDRRPPSPVPEGGPHGTIPAPVPDESTAPERAQAEPPTAPETPAPEAGDGAGRRVAGIVLDAVDGRPVDGAAVLLVHGGTRAGHFEVNLTGLLSQETTGPDGRFSLPVEAEQGLVTLVARAEGHSEARETVDLSAGEEEVVLRIEPGGMVTGRVYSPDGGLAAGAKVYAIPADAPDMLKENPEASVFSTGGQGQWESIMAVAAEDGSFEIRGLALGGVYLLRAAHPDHSPSVDVEVRPTAEHSTLVQDVVLSKPGSAVVRVLDPGGEPISKGKVYLDWGKLGLPEPLTPTAPGLYRLSKIDPGAHELRVAETSYPIVTLPFTIAAGEAAELTIRLEAGVALSGVVERDDGEPVPGVSVEARRPFGAPYRELPASDGKATTDEKGQFTIDGLRPGPHVLFHYPKGLEGIEFGPVNAPANGLRLLANRKAKLTLRLVLPPGAEPPEQVRYSVSSRPADQKIWGGAIGGWSSHAGPFGDGSLSIETGSYPLTIWLLVPGTAPHRRTAEPKPGETLDLGEVRLSAGLDLAGRVTDRNGAPVSDADVSAHLGGIAEADATTTDAGGDFRLRFLPETKVEIEVSADGFLDGSLEVDLAAGRPNLEVALARGGVVRGRVVDAEGHPVTGLDLHVFDSDRKDEPDRNDYTETDIKGEFRVRLAAGPYRIEVWRGSEQIATAETRLEEGQETPVEIALGK